MYNQNLCQGNIKSQFFNTFYFPVNYNSKKVRQALFVVSVKTAKPVFVVSVLTAMPVFVVSVGHRVF